MTDQIGTHGLSCIGDDDYAAYALSMQCNAEATDAALADSNAALEEYLARPWDRIDDYIAVLKDFLKYTAMV